MDSMPMNIHLPPDSGDQVHEFFVAQQVGADLRDPVDLRVGGDDVTQQRFGSFDVDCKIVVDEEYGNLAVLAFRASFQLQQFVHDAFIVRKRMESPKKPVTVQNSQP